MITSVSSVATLRIQSVTVKNCRIRKLNKLVIINTHENIVIFLFEVTTPVIIMFSSLLLKKMEDEVCAFNKCVNGEACAIDIINAIGMLQAIHEKSRPAASMCLAESARDVFAIHISARVENEVTIVNTIRTGGGAWTSPTIANIAEAIQMQRLIGDSLASSNMLVKIADMARKTLKIEVK